MSSDLELARAVTLRSMSEIADALGIDQVYVEPHGHSVAKISLDVLPTLAERPKAAYVVVTAVTPTPLGEG